MVARERSAHSQRQSKSGDSLSQMRTSTKLKGTLSWQKGGEASMKEAPPPDSERGRKSGDKRAAACGPQERGHSLRQQDRGLRGALAE
jgi:hypothetical protein